MLTFSSTVPSTRPRRLVGRLRLTATAVLAALAVGALADAASATTRADWGEKPVFLVQSYVDVLPELDVLLAFDVGSGAPARVTVYVPTGFELYPDRATGSVIGRAAVYSVDYLAGTSISLLEGDIVAGAASSPDAVACAGSAPEAAWIVRLAALGQLLDVPIAVRPAGPDAPPGTAFRLDLCAPDLAGTGGALLPIAALRLSLVGLEPPRAKGVYAWRAVVTPTAPDLRTILADRAYELRAIVPVPHRLTIAGRYDGAKRVAVLHGRLTGAGAARAGVRVIILRLVRTITPGGVVFRDSTAGSVRTAKDGTFTFRTRLGKTAGFVAYTYETVRSCDGPPLAVGGCLSATTAGVYSEAITISVPRNAKRT